ncbi:MAG: serine hydrolase [Bacteroidota bacterium]
MADASPSRPRQLVLRIGLALAVGLAAVLALWPRIGPEAGMESAEDLAVWVQAHPDAVSVLVWNVGTGADLMDWNADRVRPVAGLTALLLAAEYAHQAENGLDTTYQVPASVLERRRLPGIEAEEEDLGALDMPALVRAAARGHRAASDELLRVLGREGVEARLRQLELADVEPPLPVGGLLLAWAPAQWAGTTTPAEQAARFARISRFAQRDSAFARDRAFQNSAAYRAEETSRLQLQGLGLTDEEIQTAARASFPAGTVRAYADLLTRAADSTLGSPAQSERVLRSLRASRSDSVRTATGAIVGLAGAAALVVTDAGLRGAVVLVEGLPVSPDTQAEHAQHVAELAEQWAKRPEQARDRFR